MSKTTNRRRFRNYLIDRRYQLYYPGTWIVMVGLALMNFVVISLLTQGAAGGGDASSLTPLRWLSKANAALILLASAWMGFSSILHSHRIAGAMFSISRTLAKVLEGDSEAEVRLRKEDFSSDIAEQINDLIKLLRSYEAQSGGSATSEGTGGEAPADADGDQ